MKQVKLLETLYKAGLGHHLVLHRTADRIFLGNLKYEKGKLVIKDNNYLQDIKPATLSPCWDNGVIGMVCATDAHEWESLTFYGIEECVIKPDLSKTRSGTLIAAENQYGDKLIDFAGSIYRGFQLMLEHHFLPVVLLQIMRSRRGEPGLVVSDLRIAPIDINTIRALNDEVTKIIDNYVMLDIDDINISPEEFEKMFGKYTQQE